jgi:hypothetical protein
LPALSSRCNLAAYRTALFFGSAPNRASPAPGARRDPSLTSLFFRFFFYPAELAQVLG